MPHGQWVPFDVSTEETHICGKKNKANPNIKKLAKTKNREEDESIDIGYDQDDLAIIKNINKSIREKKRIDISYQSYGGQTTSRQISPVKKFKYQGEDYLQSYCHLRKDERNFKIDSFLEAKVSKKKAFKSKKMGKPKLKEYLEKVNPESQDTGGYSEAGDIRKIQNNLNEDIAGLDKLLIVLFIWLIIGTTLSLLFG